MSAATSVLKALAGALAMLAFWFILSHFAIVPRIFLPSPSQTFQALAFGWTDGDLPEQTSATLLRMIEGWLLSSFAGVLVGSAVGISSAARAYLSPTLEFLRPLPASAIIPVAIAVFGLTPEMVLGAVVFGSIWPTLLATVHGFAGIDPRLREVAQTLRLSNLAFVAKIGLPNALPDILSGMRVSMTVALIVTIVGEMITGQSGLGSAILLAGRSFQSSDLFAGLILLGALGVISNVLLRSAERRLLRWQLN